MVNIDEDEQDCLNRLFDAFPDPSRVPLATTDITDFDKIVNVSLRLHRFATNSARLRSSLPENFMYIAKRNSDEAITYILKDCDIVHLRSSILIELEKGPWDVDLYLRALWELVSGKFTRLLADSSNFCPADT